MQENRTTLGLDLGTNSIGWALVGHGDDGTPNQILRLGVRVFQEAVEAKTRAPKNHERRAARGARKVLARRKMRRETLKGLLVANGMLPDSELDVFELFKNDAYELRAKGLDDELSLLEFGRVLYHLNKRRGFLSNRKADKKGNDDAKLSEYKAEMKALEEAVADTSRTLGEYLNRQPKQRRMRTTRAMYEHEFNLLWEKQAGFKSQVLSPDLRAKVYRILFYQRPLRVQKYLVGHCTLEPKRKRAAKALLDVQRWRILQDINHLQVRNPKTFEWRTLRSDERTRLFDILDSGKSLPWKTAKRKIGLHENEIFNLEQGKKKELVGNSTSARIGKVLGERWSEMPDDMRARLVEDMLTIDSERGLLRRLQQHWKFDLDTAQTLSETELENGYARLSLRAIQNMLPYLQEGKRYDEACELAGYIHSNQSVSNTGELLGDPKDIKNPVVQKALWEVKKLVNALIKEYGKPSAIRVEMARDMKLTRKQREEFQKDQKKREKENSTTEEILKTEFGIPNPSRYEKVKYRLWMESGQMCMYTGQAIPAEILFTGQVDVDHILPYSRCLDDSYMNKIVCLASENRHVKKNQSPFEAYASTPDKWEALLVRVAASAMPFAKKRKFEEQEIKINDFIERQLNDTRYICVEVKDYLRQLGVNIEVSKGAATADLRYHWQLNRILNPDGQNSKLREDHRHHAIDALVIALTNRSLFMTLSTLSANAVNFASLTERGFRLDPPWEGFLNEVRSEIESIAVSHATSHKISGALHEETAYGFAEGIKEKKGYSNFVVRKALNSLDKPSQVEDIRDDEVRALAKARLAQCGGDFKRAFRNEDEPLLHKDGKTPIRTVRVLVPMKVEGVLPVLDRNDKPFKYFAMGSNHHVEILESKDGRKWEGRFVSTYEAAQRAREAERARRRGSQSKLPPVVQRDHGPDWKLVMALHINDMVVLDHDGKRKLFRVQKMSGADGVVSFRVHTAAVLKLESGDKEAQALYEKATYVRSRVNSLRSLNPRRVRVTPLGDVKDTDD